MNKKLVCFFSGWVEIDVDDVLLTDPDEQGLVPTKPASQWLNERGNINGLILDSFENLIDDATDGSFEELTLNIEDE